MARTTSSSASSFNGRKPATKPTVTETIEVKPEAARLEDETPESLYEKARVYAEAALGKMQMPSWTRRVVSTLLGITMAAVTAYGCLSFLDILVLATAVYTGSQFITFLVLFVGMVLTMMAAMTTATKVFDVCMQFEYSNVKARVSNWFGGFKSPAKA